MTRRELPSSLSSRCCSVPAVSGPKQKRPPRPGIAEPHSRSRPHSPLAPGSIPYIRTTRIKILLLVVASVAALTLGGCADQSLITDEEYRAVKGPAPNSPDPMAHIPQQSNRPPGY